MKELEERSKGRDEGGKDVEGTNNGIIDESNKKRDWKEIKKRRENERKDRQTERNKRGRNKDEKGRK